jgi:hypothetical protein
MWHTHLLLTTSIFSAIKNYTFSFLYHRELHVPFYATSLNWCGGPNMAKTRTNHKTYKEIFGSVICNGDHCVDDMVHLERKKCLAFQQYGSISRTLQSGF